VLIAFIALNGGKIQGVGTGNPQTVVGSKTTGATLGLTYNDAIDLYGNYRIQFVSCHGSPGVMNVAAGVTIMLDNRDAEAHTIKIGSSSYAVGAYGFRLAKSPSKGTYNITCDGGGAATLNVK